jgi:hypothetical protein
MNFYLDTEFCEDGKTVDLISIGMVADNGATLHEFNRDCNVAKANEWVVMNVFKPLVTNYKSQGKTPDSFERTLKVYLEDDVYSERERVVQAMELYLNEFGKSRARIAELVKEFVETNHGSIFENGQPVFYAYYADYDWVVFCSLFGRMIDLPKGFPMYCRDLKQLLDETLERVKGNKLPDLPKLADLLSYAKGMPGYPEQENEHDALADAKWNRALHRFIVNQL